MLYNILKNYKKSHDDQINDQDIELEFQNALYMSNTISTEWQEGTQRCVCVCVTNECERISEKLLLLMKNFFTYNFQFEHEQILLSISLPNL